MSFDDWLTRVPDTDICTGDVATCGCPECREWLENHEPEPDTFDEALATKLEEQG